MKIFSTFLWPTLLGLATIIGLLAALLEDGMWDALSCSILLVPVFVVFFFMFKQDSQS